MATSDLTRTKTLVLILTAAAIFQVGCASSRDIRGEGLFKKGMFTPPDKVLCDEWLRRHRNEPIVYEFQEVIDEVKPDLSCVQTIHTVMTVMTEEGKYTGETKVYYTKGDKLSFSALTITSDGKKFGPTLVQDMADVPDTFGYSEDRVKILSMPHVSIGSKIELSVKRNSFFRLKKEDALIHNMSSNIPVMAQRFVLILPGDLPVNIGMEGAVIQPLKHKLGEKHIYTWERSLVDKDTNPSKICVSWYKSWSSVVNAKRQQFERNLVISPSMKETVRQLIEGKSGAKEKAQAIIDFISSKFRYLSLAFNEHFGEPRMADEVFRTRYGDCKDYTIVAMAMLKEAGIDSFPVLVSPSSEGDPFSKQPSGSYFNHVILGIRVGKDPKEVTFVDAQSSGYPIGIIPSSLHGSYLLLLNQGPLRFEKIYSPLFPFETRIEYTLALREDGSASGERLRELEPEESLQFRKKHPGLILDEPSLPEQEDNTGQTRLIERKVEQTKKGQLMLRDKIEFREFAFVSGDMMVLGAGKAFYQPCFNAIDKKEGLLSPSRPVRYTEIYRFMIPEGFEFLHVPKDQELKNSWVDFSRKYEKNGRQIVITETMERRLTLETVREFLKVNEANEKISAITQDRICIRKKK